MKIVCESEAEIKINIKYKNGFGIQSHQGL